MTQATILNVPTLTYLPYCFFNILSPIMSIIVAAGRKVHGRKLVSRAAVGGTRGVAGVGLPPPGARGEPFETRLGLLCRRHGRLRPRGGAERRRDARRHDPHDPSDHAVERHALHGGQRQGQSDFKQPVLHPAHYRQRG